MPDTLEAPPAPAQDVSKTPTLLETLAGTMDLSTAPRITGRQLPPIGKEPGDKPKKEEPKKEEKPKGANGEEAKPEPAKEVESPKPEDAEALQKSAEAIADKLFKKRTTSKEADKTAGGKKGTADDKATPKADDVKPPDEKPSAEKPKATPRQPAATHVDEAAITERAAAAAATAATKAVSDSLSRTSTKPADKLDKGPEDKLSDAERKQFVVYQELEQLDPTRYKGVTAKYIKSLDEISDYVKTWSKENAGVKFDADDKEHNAFFERVEPEVDEDDWVDAKASIRARQIADKAIAPVNERMQQMERERAKAALEPLVQQKQMEAMHSLLENFDPEIAASIRKPDGAKELQAKDPITADILNRTATNLFVLSAEVVRLHDPMGGVAYDPSNAAHKEIADFIIGQEQRIGKLAPADKTRDGQMFMPRQQFQRLGEDQKHLYWFLNQDDVIDLLAQKYAHQAKNLRAARIEEFNKTAESLGYKKLEVSKEAPKDDAAKPKETPKPKETAPSPEATSRASVKTTPGGPVTPNNDVGSAIAGALFHRLRSS